MSLSDDVKNAARDAAQKLKDMMGAETLPAKTETVKEMETGSPQTPGYLPDYGQTMKPTPQWPEAKEAQPMDSRESVEQNRDQDLDR
jgi:hypothetical protein